MAVTAIWDIKGRVDKVISYANDATAMVTAESVAQGLAVSQMIATLKGN